MTGNLKYSDKEQLEEESRIAFKSLLPHNFLARDIRDRDKAIDMEIELAKGEDLSGNRILVQLKSTKIQPKKPVPSYRFKTKHLKYWKDCVLPVIIVYGIKKANRKFDFYYLSAQEFIFNTLPKQKISWRSQKTLTVKFPLKLKNIEKTFNDILLNSSLIIASHQLSANNPNGATYFLDGIPHSDNLELKQLTANALDFLIKENYPEAITKLEYILKTLTLSPTEKLSIFLNLGNAYLSLCQLNKAEENYRTIIVQKERMNQEEALLGEAAALGNIGLVYRAQGKYEEALEHHQAALKIHRELGLKEGEANQLGNIGPVFQDQGKYEEALEHLQAALKIHRELGLKEGEAADLGNIGVVYRAQGKYEEALEHLQAALKIHRELGLKKGEAAALGNIGVVYQDQGKYEEALEHHQAALAIDRELGLKEGEANQLGNIGLVFRVQGKYEEALEHHQAALKIHCELGLKGGEANQLGNIGLVFQDQGKYEEALEYLQAALAIDRELRLKKGEAADLGNIGLVFQDQGKYEEALEYLQAALRIFTREGYTISYAKTLISIGITYTKLAEIREKEKNCKLAHNYLKRASEIDLEEENHEMIEFIQESLESLRFICY